MAETTTELLGKDLFLREFEQLMADGDRPGGDLFDVLRLRGIERFSEHGFPHTRLEEWRQTSLAGLQRLEFSSARTVEPDLEIARQLLASVSFDELGGERMVFVNGRYVEELSSIHDLPKGVTATPLSRMNGSAHDVAQHYLGGAAPIQDHSFSMAALNTALFSDGAVLVVPKHTKVDVPIQVVHLTVPGGRQVWSAPRNLYVVGEGSEATIIETYAGEADGVYFTNAVSEAMIGDNASVDYYRIQQESKQAWFIGMLQEKQGAEVHFANHTITMGALLSRNDIRQEIAGENGHSTMNGLYLLDGNQQCDNHTFLDHAVPHCTSLELYKGILEDKAKAVFTGKILVRQDAQKTDAIQSNRALLLSDDAQVNSQPQLEIFADDVKCTHGATVGALDPAAKFYLMARGIPEAQAMGLLTYAFANEIIEHIKIEPLRDRLEHIISNMFRDES